MTRISSLQSGASSFKAIEEPLLIQNASSKDCNPEPIKQCCTVQACFPISAPHLLKLLLLPTISSPVYLPLHVSAQLLECQQDHKRWARSWLRSVW